MAVRMACWIDGPTYAAQDWRLSLSTLLGGDTPLGVSPGVRMTSGHPLRVTATNTPSMTLHVAPGLAAVAGTEAANQGGYLVAIDAVEPVTLAPADPSNPRLDLVVVRVTDTGDDKSTTTVEPVTGQPSATPVRPAAPPNSLILAEVRVNPGTKSVGPAGITDLRVPLRSSAGAAVSGYSIRQRKDHLVADKYNDWHGLGSSTTMFIAGRAYRLFAGAGMFTTAGPVDFFAIGVGVNGQRLGSSGLVYVRDMNTHVWDMTVSTLYKPDTTGPAIVNTWIRFLGRAGRAEVKVGSFPDLPLEVLIEDLGPADALDWNLS